LPELYKYHWPYPNLNPHTQTFARENGEKGIWRAINNTKTDVKITGKSRIKIKLFKKKAT
jgi:hypothetical protein